MNDVFLFVQTECVAINCSFCNVALKILMCGHKTAQNSLGNSLIAYQKKV